MKAYKIIIAVALLLLLLIIALLPTVYSKNLADVVMDSPQMVERMYGDFDFKIESTTGSTYFAYEMDISRLFNKEQFFIIEYYEAEFEESRLSYHIYEGTEWIEEVSK